MAAMFVHVRGDLATAERACLMVFGEDADRGPVRPAPKRLLEVLKVWPGHPEDVLTVALELPITSHDVERARSSQSRAALTLRVCKLDVIHEGRKIGEALRTDTLGINALAVYDEAVAIYRRLMN